MTKKKIKVAGTEIRGLTATTGGFGHGGGKLAAAAHNARFTKNTLMSAKARSPLALPRSMSKKQAAKNLQALEDRYSSAKSDLHKARKESRSAAAAKGPVGTRAPSGGKPFTTGYWQRRTVSVNVKQTTPASRGAFEQHGSAFIPKAPSKTGRSAASVKPLSAGKANSSNRRVAQAAKAQAQPAGSRAKAFQRSLLQHTASAAQFLHGMQKKVPAAGLQVGKRGGKFVVGSSGTKIYVGKSPRKGKKF